MELMVPIDNQSRLPLYEQIYQYMKEEIQSGRISAGSRLPSTRILAENLKVSRSTTQMAYEQLLSEGISKRCPVKDTLYAGSKNWFGWKKTQMRNLRKTDLKKKCRMLWIFPPEVLIWTAFPLIPGAG